MEQVLGENFPDEDEEIQIVEEWLQGHYWANPRYPDYHIGNVHDGSDGDDELENMPNGHASDDACGGQSNGNAEGPSPPVVGVAGGLLDTFDDSQDPRLAGRTGVSLTGELT